MELFRAKKVAEIESASTKACRVCNEKLNLVRTVMDTGTGKLFHMFECECGERTWEE
jgi:hypothetical protein